jgi:hypothetical protein
VQATAESGVDRVGDPSPQVRPEGALLDGERPAGLDPGPLDGALDADPAGRAKPRAGADVADDAERPDDVEVAGDVALVDGDRIDVDAGVAQDRTSVAGGADLDAAVGEGDGVDAVAEALDDALDVLGGGGLDQRAAVDDAGVRVLALGGRGPGAMAAGGVSDTRP